MKTIKMNKEELCEELDVAVVVSGPMYEIWKLYESTDEDRDELVYENEVVGSKEAAMKFVEEHNLRSCDEYEVVIEEVYEVKDEEEDEGTYYKALYRETV